MDTLPPELLGMIADSIQQNPRPFQRQRSLAALARTNKALYAACNPRLYRSPILSNCKTATKWARFYTRRVNPWTLSKVETDFTSVVVPVSVTFKARGSDDDEKAKPIFKRLPNLMTVDRLSTIAFAPALFRNLTSFAISNNDPLDDNFLATLFGPLGTNRLTIVKLTIRRRGHWPLIPFILEAHGRMELTWNKKDLLSVYKGWITTEFFDAEEIQDVLACIEEEEDDLLANYELQETAHRLAREEYSVFRSMKLVTPRQSDILSSFQRTRAITCHPFTSLRSLTLSLEDGFDLYLIFLSSLFPAIQTMKLTGYCETSIITVKHDAKLIRHSITQRKGLILPPNYDTNVYIFLNDIPESWDPLTQEELESEPIIAYSGPNLSKLDLSELRFMKTTED